MKQISSHTILNNGIAMPWLGLGTYKSVETEGQEAVRTAIELGYRAIDTASFYNNEEEIGQAIAESGVARSELFVTTKLWNDDHGYDNALRAFENSQKRLGLDVIDLYLIHWPGKEKYKETWKAFERLYEERSVRAIGVSNFNPHHLDHLLQDANVVPAVNQVELHPRFGQKELRTYCKPHDIRITAWSPLMRGGLAENSTLLEIASKYNKSTAQVILRWNIQSEIMTIPKSVRRERMEENANIFDFELTIEELERINELDENRRTGANPDELLF